MMYNKNSDHKGLAAPPMSPRISFSNDFVESSSSHSHSHHQNKAAYIDAPPAVSSADFEFSVSNYSMTTADELFSKGKLLPLKVKTTTLRDELQNDDDDDIDDLSSKPPKNPARLRGFLGLRKPHIVSRKSVKAEGSVESCSKNSQDSVDE